MNEKLIATAIIILVCSIFAISGINGTEGYESANFEEIVIIDGSTINSTQITELTTGIMDMMLGFFPLLVFFMFLGLIFTQFHRIADSFNKWK